MSLRLHLRDAEIAQLHVLPLGKEDILCLEVSVEDALAAPPEVGLLVKKETGHWNDCRMTAAVSSAHPWMYARAETSSQSQSMICSCAHGDGRQ